MEIPKMKNDLTDEAMGAQYPNENYCKSINLSLEKLTRFFNFKPSLLMLVNDDSFQYAGITQGDVLKVEISDSPHVEKLKSDSNSEDIKARIAELEARIIELEAEPKENDFVEKMVEQAKKMFKRKRDVADELRNLFIKVDRIDAATDLDQWLDENERRNGLTINGPLNDIHDNEHVNAGF